MRIYLRELLPKAETNAKRVIDRLQAAGWIAGGGTNHEKFAHPDRPGMTIIVPRHKTLSPAVARAIAKAAGWI